MAVISGGLLSFNSSGTIAKTAVYSRWRGRQYVRKHVVPKNPRSSQQVSNRLIFTWLTQAWKSFGGFIESSWFLKAQGRPLTDRNEFMKANTRALQAGSDLSTMQFATASGGGIAPTAVVSSSPGAGELKIDWTAPNMPFGWSDVQYGIIAMNNLDPHMTTDYRQFFVAAAGPITTLTLTGIPSGITVAWQLIVQETKPTTPTTNAFAVSSTGTQLIA